MSARRVRVVVMALAALALVLIAAGSAAGVSRAPRGHGYEWHWLHGREASTNIKACRKCHSSYSCKACHFADFPHPRNWQAGHGAESLRLRGKGCPLCHRNSFCDPCHGGVRMPHPRGFSKSHTSGGSDPEACSICHTTSDCEPCHKRHDAHRAGGMILGE